MIYEGKMGEYIKREDAFAALTEYYHHKSGVQHEALQEALSRVPAADVQPVVHGKWIVVQTFEDCVYANCSNCDVTQIFYYNKPLTKFCSDCGAKIDL